MKLYRSGLTVAFFTFISRVFGLIRELFIAALFGANDTADAVNVASKLPSLFRRIFGEGALSTVFIPLYNEKMLGSLKEAKKFSGEIFTLLVTILVALTIFMQLFMPYIMYLIAPGFSENIAKFQITVYYSRITIPYVIFVSIAALFGGILNTAGRFAAFAFSPIILSLGIIFFTLILKDLTGEGAAISYGVLLSGIIQVLFMTFCLYRAKLLFKLSFNLRDKSVVKFLYNMGPAALSSGVQQLNLFISQSIASFVPGAVSILAYADRIYQFPLSIIGITFSTILLPELSKSYKKNNVKEAIKIQHQAIKAGMFLALPAATGILLLSRPIIHAIYFRGAFTIEDTYNTASAIGAFSLGLPAFILSKILTPIFYAHQDTKTPLKITIYSISANTFLNIILMKPFGTLGIALGTSIAAWLNVWMVGYNISKKHQFYIPLDVLLFLGKALISCVFMALILLLVRYNFENFYYVPSSLINICSLGVSILLGAVGFFSMSLILKLHKEL